MTAGGPDEVNDCDEAMRLVLRFGLLEIRALASKIDSSTANDSGVDELAPRDRIFMLANLLHHVPSYLGGGTKMLGPDPAPFRDGQAGFNWLCSLWQARNETQEAWLVAILAIGGYTVEQLIGPDEFSQIEATRAKMRSPRR